MSANKWWKSRIFASEWNIREVQEIRYEEGSKSPDSFENLRMQYRG